MSRKISDAFASGKAFIPFITCGDPSLELTEQIVYAMEEAGADLIELGIPFSDPTAEGPVIQAANVRALAGGVTTDKIFEMAERIRKKTDIPMVFMTYANVVFSYGTERFVKKAAEIGMNGIILPDVPFEEKQEFDSVCREYGLDFISLIAPTSHERISMIAKEASGFVYCVSSLGVTGMRSDITTDIGAMVSLVKKANDIPCAVGFGISTPEQAAEMAAKSDGAIVGSAIVKLCEKYGCELKNVLTGFKYIGEVILNLEKKGEEDRYVFGFEESYGYLAGTYVRDKDAVVASMLVCEMAAFYKKHGKSLAQVIDSLYEEYGYYLNHTSAFEFDGAAGMEKMNNIMAEIRENIPTEIDGKKVVKVSDYLLKYELDTVTGEKTAIDLPTSNVISFGLEGDNGVIIRPSGTEPKIKAYITAVGKDFNDAESIKDSLVDASKKLLGIE